MVTLIVTLMVIIIQIMYLSIIPSSRFIRTIFRYFSYFIQVLIILPFKIVIYTFLNLILHTEYDINNRKFSCFLAFIFKTLNPVESFSLLPLLYRTIQPVSSAEYSYLSVLSYTQQSLSEINFCSKSFRYILCKTFFACPFALTFQPDIVLTGTCSNKGMYISCHSFLYSRHTI